MKEKEEENNRKPNTHIELTVIDVLPEYWTFNIIPSAIGLCICVSA